MKLVVGLGNPGPRYAGSRHNVGYRVVEALARGQGLTLDEERHLGRWAEGWLPPADGAPADRPAEPLALLVPETFMNRSGDAVASALAAFPDLDPARDLLIVYDDLDLPLGRIRLRPRGGAGGHRGMESVLGVVGTREVPRLRFGIGRPEAGSPAPREAVVDFVLDGFTPAEEQRLAVQIPRAAEAAVVLLREGAVVAMDRFNGADEP